MTAIQATLAGRREAEKLMTSTVSVVEREFGPIGEDGNVTIIEHPRYSGKARIRLQGAGVTDVDAASQLLAIQRLILSLPMTGSESVGNDQWVTVTADPLDTALVGTQYLIKGAFAQSHATARRFTIERAS